MRMHHVYIGLLAASVGLLLLLWYFAPRRAGGVFGPLFAQTAVTESGKSGVSAPPMRLGEVLANADVINVFGQRIPIPRDSDSADDASMRDKLLRRVSTAKTVLVPVEQIVVFGSNDAGRLQAAEGNNPYNDPALERVVTFPFLSDNRTTILMDGSPTSSTRLPQYVQVQGSRTPTLYTPPGNVNGRMQYASLKPTNYYVGETWLKLFTVGFDMLRDGNMGKHDSINASEIVLSNVYVPLLVTRIYLTPNLCTYGNAVDARASNSNNNGQRIDCSQAPTMPARKMYAMVDTGSGTFMTTQPSLDERANATFRLGNNTACVKYAMGDACGVYAGTSMLVRAANKEQYVKLDDVMGIFQVQWSMDRAQSKNYATDVSILGLSPIPDITPPGKAQPFITRYAGSTGLAQSVALWLAPHTTARGRVGYMPRMMLGKRPSELRGDVPALTMMNILPFRYYPSVLARVFRFMLRGQLQLEIRNVPVIFDTGTTRSIKLASIGERASTQQFNTTPFPSNGLSMNFDHVILELPIFGRDESLPQYTLSLRTVGMERDGSALIEFNDITAPPAMNTIVVGINGMMGRNWYIDYDARQLFVEQPSSPA